MAQAKLMIPAAAPKKAAPPPPAPVQMKSQPSPAPTPQLNYSNIGRSVSPVAPAPVAPAGPRTYAGGTNTATGQAIGNTKLDVTQQLQAEAAKVGGLGNLVSQNPNFIKNAASTISAAQQPKPTSGNSGIIQPGGTTAGGGSQVKPGPEQTGVSPSGQYVNVNFGGKDLKVPLENIPQLSQNPSFLSALGSAQPSADHTDSSSISPNTGGDIGKETYLQSKVIGNEAIDAAESQTTGQIGGPRGGGVKGGGGKAGPPGKPATTPGGSITPEGTIFDVGGKSGFAYDIGTALGIKVLPGGKRDAYEKQQYGKGAKGLNAANAAADKYQQILGDKAQVFAEKGKDGSYKVKFQYNKPPAKAEAPPGAGGTGIPGPVGEAVAAGATADTKTNEFVTNLFSPGGFMSTLINSQKGGAATFDQAQAQVQQALPEVMEGSPGSEQDVQAALDAFTDTAQRDLDIDFRNNVRAVNQELVGAGEGNSSFLPQMLANGATRNYVLGMTDIANKRELLNQQVRDAQSTRRNNSIKTMLGVAAPTTPSIPRGVYPQPGTFQAPASQSDWLGILQNLAISLPMGIRDQFIEANKNNMGNLTEATNIGGGLNLGGIGSAAGGIAGLVSAFK